jgi:hypothetical protein
LGESAGNQHADKIARAHYTQIHCWVRDEERLHWAPPTTPKLVRSDGPGEASTSQELDYIPWLIQLITHLSYYWT